MNSLATKKVSGKILWPIILLVLGIIAYFIYEGFFSSATVSLDTSNNEYVSNTKIGQDIDIINKENIVFNTNINNDLLTNAKDFSIKIEQSNSEGRANPFLP